MVEALGALMLVIGHRGAPTAAPENTLEAFRLATAQGADGVELDLRRTADGAVVVHHDAALPDGRRIMDLAADELPDWVPGLDEALEVCAGFEITNLEIKNSPAEPDFDPAARVAVAVVQALRRRPGWRERALVSCFHLPTLDGVRELDEKLATGWLVLPAPDLADRLERAAARRHRAVHPFAACVDSALVESAHRLGLAVNTWTVDDPSHIVELARAGVDGVITNVPDRALAALGRAGGAGA